MYEELELHILCMYSIICMTYCTRTYDPMG